MEVRRLIAAVVFLGLAGVVTPAHAQDAGDIMWAWSRFVDQLSREPYPLDTVSRAVQWDEDGDPVCPDVDLVPYAGDVVAYERELAVNPHFRKRLIRFEEIVAETARELYGRAPARILHRGVHVCRVVRGHSWRLSEHALANAIDVAGFEWDAAPDGKGPVAGPFEVSVERHWDAEGGIARKHSTFLRMLVGRLRRDRVFRGMIVPPAPGHDDHFHLDMGWWVFQSGAKNVARH